MTNEQHDQPLTGRRILIVEDEYLIAADIADAVARLGGDTLGPCADVEAARRVLAESRPDGAVLDLNLKGSPVTELARELEGMGIAIIYHTGYDTTAAAEGLPEGVLALKPLKHDVLMRELALGLGRNRSPA